MRLRRFEPAVAEVVRGHFGSRCVWSTAGAWAVRPPWRWLVGRWARPAAYRVCLSPGYTPWAVAVRDPGLEEVAQREAFAVAQAMVRWHRAQQDAAAEARMRESMEREARHLRDAMLAEARDP